MELLTPVGWADVATKRDLDSLEERVNLRFEVLEHSLSHAFERELRAAITSQTRILAMTLVGTMLTTSGVAFATATVLG